MDSVVSRNDHHRMKTPQHQDDSLSAYDYRELGYVAASVRRGAPSQNDPVDHQKYELDLRLASRPVEDWAIATGRCSEPTGRWDRRVRQYDEEHDFYLAHQIAGAGETGALLVRDARRHHMERRLGAFESVIDGLAQLVLENARRGRQTTADDLLARAEELYRDVSEPVRPPLDMICQAERLRVAAEILIGQDRELRLAGIFIDRDPHDCVGVTWQWGKSIADRYGGRVSNVLVDAHRRAVAEAFAETALAGQLAHNWFLYTKGFLVPETEAGTDRWIRVTQFLRQHHDLIEQLADALPVNVIVVEQPLDVLLARFHLE